mgnify:CR=1 FL=1
MNKNVLIAIVVILVLVVLGVGGYMLLNNNKEVKSIDIDAAGQTLANTTPFNEMATMDITTEELSSLYGINTDNVEKTVGKMPMMNVQASMYVLIQAKDGTVETVREELNKYAQQYEEQWSMYLPEQYELVQNRKMGVVGNTVYMIIAENAETLEQEITK